MQRTAQPKTDPFAFQEQKITKAPASPKAPRITWPQRERSRPLYPEDVAIPPPPPNRDALVSEIVKMLSSAEAEQLTALRDKLRGEGFWKGLMEKPEPGKGKAVPFMAKDTEEEIKALGPEAEEPQEPLEPPASTPGIERLRERFKARPAPRADPIARPTDYETRLKGQSSQ